MKRTEALEAIRQAQLNLSAAQDALTYAYVDLEDAECDHSDTTGHVCDHCGVFDDNPEHHEWDDYLRVLYADCDALLQAGHIYTYFQTYPVPAIR